VGGSDNAQLERADLVSRPVSSWPDKDKAWRDVSKGLRRLGQLHREVSLSPSLEKEALSRAGAFDGETRSVAPGVLAVFWYQSSAILPGWFTELDSSRDKVFITLKSPGQPEWSTELNSHLWGN
jgi:hypothetical protein